jgi:hypothetical protein
MDSSSNKAAFAKGNFTSRFHRLSLDLSPRSPKKRLTYKLPPLINGNVNVTERLKLRGETKINPPKVYNNIMYDDWDEYWANKPLRNDKRHRTNVKDLQRKMRNPKTYINPIDDEKIETAIRRRLSEAANSLLYP